MSISLWSMWKSSSYEWCTYLYVSEGYSTLTATGVYGVLLVLGPAVQFLGPPVVIMQCTIPYILLLFLFSFFLQCEMSAISWPIAMKLCHVIGTDCSFKNKVQNLWVLPPKKYGERKCAFFSIVLHNFALQSQISPEQNRLSTTWKRCCKLRSLPRLLT